MTSSGTILGFDKARLKRIDRFLADQYVTPGRYPGAALLINRGGERAHVSVQGWMDRENKVPMAEDTIVRIYSMTKPIASIALMMLVEQGLIALEDPVHRYIPAWKGLGVYRSGELGSFQTRPAARPMLVIDLLRHTSGLTYAFQTRTNVDAAYRKLKLGEIEKSGTLDEMIEKLASLPLDFSPGDAWNYSVSTDVVGYLVGKVSGEPFEVFLRKHIFVPLGMHDTDFHVHEGKHHRLANSYALPPGGDTILYDPAKTSSFLKPPSFISGGGGLVSTLGDYERFCRMLVRGGELDGVRVVAPRTLALMTMNHLPGGKTLASMSQGLFSEAGYDGLGFGLGFATTIDQAAAQVAGNLGDFTWGGAASTYFWCDPAEDLFVIFLTQLLPSTSYPFRRQLRTMVYSALAETRTGWGRAAAV